MNYSENDIKALFAAFNAMSERIEELEEIVRKLQGKKKCVILEMKPKQELWDLSKTSQKDLSALPLTR